MNEPPNPPLPIDEPPARTVEALAASPHGIYSLSAENRQRLELVRRNPAPYLTAIRELHPPGTVAPRAREARTYSAFVTTAMVLGQVEDPAAADVLAAWWEELDRALADPTYRDVAAAIGRMQDAVLAALGSRPREAVISAILGQLERMDERRRVDSLHYLIRSSRGNAEVIRRLRAIHDASGSPLHGDRDVANAIARLSEAR
jgi:hypothetical protein